MTQTQKILTWKGPRISEFYSCTPTIPPSASEPCPNDL